MTTRKITVQDLRGLLSLEWQAALGLTFNESYWVDIVKTLNTGPFKPALRDIFNALNKCPPTNVKCVIIGQDPYPQPGYAHGYSFSTNNGVIPRSLQNVFKELSQEYGFTGELSSNLSGWADEGVLLLNSLLTVGKEPMSHRGLWEDFTRSVIRYVDEHNRCVFMAWGAHARGVVSIVQHNSVLTSGHPSPVNTKSDFAGCGHFRKCNDILRAEGLLPVRWIPTTV